MYMLGTKYKLMRCPFSRPGIRVSKRYLEWERFLSVNCIKHRVVLELDKLSDFGKCACLQAKTSECDRC